MGVGVDALLRNLDIFEILNPKIHDIRIKFASPPSLHESLVEKGCSANPSNKLIKMYVPLNDGEITAQLLIYPETIQAIIGNTNKPIIHDLRGLSELSLLLGRIQHHLYIHSYIDNIPHPHDWIIYSYHFHKDFRVHECDGKTDHITVGDFCETWIRVYNKDFPDGTCRIRLESIENPNRTIIDEFSDVLKAKQESYNE